MWFLRWPRSTFLFFSFLSISVTCLPLVSFSFPFLFFFLYYVRRRSLSGCTIQECFFLSFHSPCLVSVYNILSNHQTVSKERANAYMTCKSGAGSVPSYKSHVITCVVGRGSVSSRLFVIPRDVPLPQNFLPFLCVGIDFIKKNFDPSKPLFPTFFNSSNFTTQFHNGGSSGVRRGDRYRSWYGCRINNPLSTSFLDI